MKLKFLGTAAYEGVPSLFCDCRVCRLSREKGGRNMRSRSQAIVNDELLLEFNADTVWHSQVYGFDWNKIRDCLITHSHCDHLYSDDIDMINEPYTHGSRKIGFYAAEDGYNKIKHMADRPNNGASVTLVTPGKRFVTSAGYEVMPLEADHDKKSSPVFYSVAKDGKRMLYAHDTGYFFEHVWGSLKQEGRFDLVSLDCTGCIGKGGEWRENHMSFGTNLQVFERMEREGMIDGKTVKVVNHFSHNGGQTYDEMREYADKFGIVTAYDGLEIEF